MKASPLAVLLMGSFLLLAAGGKAHSQVLFFDNFQQFGNGTVLTSTNYTPASGPLAAVVTNSVQNGSPTIKATNFFGSFWAFFDNSTVTNKNQYKGLLSSAQTNQPLRVTWKMWIQATNSGPGMFLLSVPVNDANPGVTFNPPLVFMDTGAIVAFTNGTSPQIVIGNWGSLAGTVMTNTLVLDYPTGKFSYTLNGQTLTNLPLGPYFTNAVDAIYFNGFERTAGSLGNRFAIDEVKVEVVTPATAAPFRWARRVAGTLNPDSELAIGLAMDSAGNVYVTGWFDGTNDFGGVTLTNTAGGGQDIFTAKYDANGALQWARRAGANTPSRDGGRGVGVDAAGNVYVTGEFYGNAGFGGFTLSGAVDQQQFFLAKYDSAGTMQWVRQSTGAYSVYGTALAVDGAGNSYAVGYANNGQTVTFGTTNLLNTNGGGYSAFLVKYNNAGVVQWAQLLASPDQVYTTSVALDGGNNVHVAGSFNTSMSAGATNFASAGNADGFVAKFNSNGALQWARQISGLSDASAQGVAADASGNVYVAGGFGNAAGDTVSFGSGITLTNIGAGLSGTGVGDAFLAKYDSATGTAQWARRAGGTNFDAYTGVAADPSGNIYAGGARDGMGLPGGFNAVVAKYDSNGVVQWVQSSAGTNGALVFTHPVVDAGGNCYLAGWFQTNAVFGTNILTGAGYWDFFVTEIGYGPLTLKIGLSNSVPKLSVLGDIGTHYSLEYVPALPASNNWQGLVTNTLTASPFVHTDSNVTVNAKRFYRLRVLP